MDKKLTDPKVLKEFLKKEGFVLKKSLGQNFLISDTIAREIVDRSEVHKDTLVIEIGPGIGTLTDYILENTKNILAVEIDNKGAEILKKRYEEYEDVHILNEDILKVDLKKSILSAYGEKKFKKIIVIANLPYYITTPILFYLLEKNDFIDTITVMVQMEVARRMISGPGSKDYGALSLAIKYYTDSEIIVDVSRQSFIPAPKVESGVVYLKVNNGRRLPEEEEKMLFKVIRGSFNQRRKTLQNGMKSIGIDKEITCNALKKIGLDESIRGEKLTLEDFKNLIKNF